MTHLATPDNKRKLPPSKFERTILTNRNMNILLRKKLELIEVNRKRTLAEVERLQREVKAELRVKKDEKFNLMLKHQKKKFATSKAKVKIQDDSAQNSFANDIEGELFTTGLLNAPGVHSRMNRLGQRRRILPDFDSEGSDESEDENHHLDDNLDFDSQNDPYHLNLAEKPTIRPQTVPDSIMRRPVKNPVSSSQSNRPAGGEKSEATVFMTSGVVTYINEDAGLKQIAKAEDDSEFQPQETSTLPVPITGFSIHSQMRNRNVHPLTQPQASNASRNRTLPHAGQCKSDRKKSVQFSRHRNSIIVAPDPFGDDEPTSQPLFSVIGGKGSHSRLSVVKSKIESNEKAFLLRLRIQNQKVENEEVAKRVWDFIGKRPTSMFVPRMVSKKDSEGGDVLSEAEEELKRAKFKAAASKTADDA